MNHIEALRLILIPESYHRMAESSEQRRLQGVFSFRLSTKRSESGALREKVKVHDNDHDIVHFCEEAVLMHAEFPPFFSDARTHFPPPEERSVVLDRGREKASPI